MRTYSYHIRRRNGWGTGCGPNPTHCHQCGAALPDKPAQGATGYACGESAPVTDVALLVQCGAATLKRGEIIEQSPAICYACCATNDVQYMREHGRITLYLSRDAGGHYRLGNWPGTLTFQPFRVRKGQHNMARVRYDAWFTGPDSTPWHAVQYGDNTMIAHCRRLKAAA